VTIKSLEPPSSQCFGWFLIGATRRSDNEVDFEVGLIGSHSSFHDLALYRFTLDEHLMDVVERHPCQRFSICFDHREGCFAYLGQRRLAVGHPKRGGIYSRVEVLEIPTRQSEGSPPIIAVGFLDKNPQGLTVLRGDSGAFLVVDPSPLEGFGQLTWFPIPDGW
jgi:hypothetical protein